MISNSPTFCPAPWTGLNIDQNGRVTPCMHCLSSVGNIKKNTIQEVINGPELKDIKQHMADGKWHDACNWCKRLEDTTGHSGRTQRHADQKTIDAINADISWFDLEHLVVNWSNLCNLSCTYCNPETSTAWQSALKIPINHDRNEHQDLIELAKTNGHSLQGLTLGGGEPLLQKGLGEFLKHLDSNKVNVLVTTNLSVELENNPIYQELKTWPRVSWMISFDNANQQKFEYVRNGADWDQFIKNIQTMKRDNQRVTAHPAYSIYCAWDLIEYYDFCQFMSLDIFWCELNHPQELDIRRMPIDVRQHAIDEIDLVLTKYQGQQNISLDILERYKLTLNDNSYLPPMDRDLYVTDWHRDIEQKLKKTTRFEDLWPDMAVALKEVPDVK
jgi:radical SAM protein with 4Fe4S-binding SPASM domain